MAGFSSEADKRAITSHPPDKKRKTASIMKLGKRPFFLIRPIPGIFGIDLLLDCLYFHPLFVHGIRIQRNVEADLSANRMAVYVAVQIILVSVAYVTAAVARHALQ